MKSIRMEEVLLFADESVDLMFCFLTTDSLQSFYSDEKK